MTKRNRIILAVVIVAVLAITVWLMLKPRTPNPVYSGVPLSEWVSTIHRVRPGLPNLDSNAVPYLIQTLKTRDGPMQKTYINLYPHFPMWLKSRLNYPLPAPVRVAIACEFLGSLGPTARPAIPELMRMMNPEDKRRAQSDAIFALCRIASTNDAEVVKAILAAARSPDAGTRAAALRGLADLDPETAARAWADAAKMRRPPPR